MPLFRLVLVSKRRPFDRQGRRSRVRGRMPPQDRTLAGDGPPTGRSRRRSPLLLLLLALFWLAGSGAGTARAQEWMYVLRPGENPWSITRRYLKGGLRYWRPLIELNGIRKPRQMPPGTVVRIPARWLRVVPSSARIERLSGEVRIADASGSRKAAEGDALTGGETVSVGSEGSALVRLANGSEILLTPGSSIRFDALSGYANTLMVDAVVRLLAGRIEATTKRQGSLDRLEIHGPVAVSAVRGTRFRLGTEEKADRVEVLTGRVAFSAARRSLTVTAGLGTFARAGRPPAPPRPLLPAPALSPRSLRLERLPLGIEVVPVPGAVAYRVQLAADAKFALLLVDRLDVGPRLSLGPLDDGVYALRLRAVDADGIEGLDLEASVEVDARPVPPLLISPPQGGRNRTQPPEFRWAEVEGAAGYRFELGGEGGFRFVADPVTGSRLTLPEALPPGSYRWRLATIAADGERGPFGDFQRFRQLPPTPRIDAPPGMEVADERIALRWVDAGPAYRYRVQMAYEPGFRQPFFDRVLETNEVAFDPASAAAVFIRIAVVEPDGYEGAFGPVHRVDLPRAGWWPLVLLPFLLALLL